MLAFGRLPHPSRGRTRASASAILVPLALLLALSAACGSSGGATNTARDASAASSDDASSVSHTGDDASDAFSGAEASNEADANPPVSAEDAQPACNPISAAFYIAPSGDDTNPCSLTQPCQSFEKAQQQMAASSTIKTTYVRAGTYTRTAPYTFNSNETWLGFPCDPPHSATIDATGLSAGGPAFFCNGCSNVAMWNFTFSGAPTYDSGAYEDTNIAIASGTNVYIDNNVFTGNVSSYEESDILSFNGNGIHIRGNVFESSASGEPISTPFTVAATYSGLYITDNSFSGCERWCVESQIQPTQTTVSDFHIDRNTFTDFAGPNAACGSDPDHYSGAISAAGPSGTTPWATNATIWGNTFTLPSTSNTCVWGIEVGWPGTSVEHNTMAYLGAAMAIAGVPGTEIENNDITLLTSGSYVPNCGGGACSFSTDGGYNGSEWIGVNTINGASVTGCLAPSCGLGHGAYGAQPTVSSASPVYAGAPP